MKNKKNKKNPNQRNQRIKQNRIFTVPLQLTLNQLFLEFVLVLSAITQKVIYCSNYSLE